MSRNRLLGLAAVATLALFLDGHAPAAFSQSSGNELIILSSASLHGELAPCG